MFIPISRESNIFEAEQYMGFASGWFCIQEFSRIKCCPQSTFALSKYRLHTRRATCEFIKVTQACAINSCVYNANGSSNCSGCRSRSTFAIVAACWYLRAQPQIARTTRSRTFSCCFTVIARFRFVLMPRLSSHSHDGFSHPRWSSDSIPSAY